MKIRTKLRIGTIVTTALVLVFIIAIFFLTFIQQQLYQKGQGAEKISETSFQLESLRSEYIAHPNERSKTQWVHTYEVLSRLLDQARPLFTSSTEKELFEAISSASDDSRILFGQLVENIEHNSNQAVIEELSNQMTLKAQTRVAGALQLAELSRQEASDASLIFTVAITILGLIIAAISIVVYLSSSKITDSIRILGEGTKIIAGGDYSYQLSIRSQDEIGDLAQLFNTMALQVQESRAHLEERVEQRTQELEKALTKEKRSQEALLNVMDDLKKASAGIEDEARNTRKFQQAVQASTDAIAITLPDMTYVYTNPAWSKLTGYIEQEVMGKSPRLIISEKTEHALTERLFALTKAAAAEEEEEEAILQSDEFMYRRKDGSEYNAEVNVYPIKEHGKTVFFVLIHRDVSDRKRTDRAKSEFISIASHQLRTPLTEIRWALSNLEHQQITDKQKEIVKSAHKASAHMAETIKAMLTISHIETGELSPEPKDVSLHSLIHDIVSLYDTMQRKKKIVLTMNCSQDIHVHTDEQLLKEILSNLLTNAYKYTPGGGSVHISVQQEKEHVRIDVVDTGCGIPRHEQKRVSEKFFRGSNVVDKEEEGNGIGLNMAYSLVKLLGGTISFVSQENKGTTFSLTLPSPPL